MNQRERLSHVTQRYLDAYYSILNEMICGMTQAELSDSISYNFIVQMVPHHRAAIEMSENLLQYTTNIPLQDIALQIIEEQTKSIENMQQIKKCCNRRNSTRRELCQYQAEMNRILQNMFSRMRNARVVNSINVNFMNEMIPHHEGAISMSETTLQYEICPELVPILEAIITSQRRGVKQMKGLLKEMESSQSLCWEEINM